MNISFSQLMTAAFVLGNYEDDYDPEQPVVITAVDGSLPPDVEVDLDGIRYRITPAGQLIDAQGKVGQRS